MESISFHTLTSLSSLRKLDLSWRQIEDEDFPKNLHAFSSLEELHLSGNSKLIQLPASISHLSCLKHLELNECCRLQNLHALPSGIQVLKACHCSALENIEDLSKEYEWLYKIWLVGCMKLLEDQENERYLDKMLQQSFLKKCAAVDHRLSIAIPGSKIPSWFKKQHGCDIALKLPPKWQTQIMGFVVCGVFHKKWRLDYVSPLILFRFESDGKFIPESEVDCINASAAAENGNMWIGYIPLSFFQQRYDDFQREDWSHIIKGNLVMTVMLTDGNESVRCGAHIVYKEDVEPLQQIKSFISDYWNMECVYWNGNAYVYHEWCIPVPCS